jgi:streptogramin lyase
MANEKAAEMASRPGHLLGSAAANTITEFPIPNSNTGLWDIAAGPDGNLWFTGYTSNTIGRMTPGGTITATFSIPTANSHPTDIAAGPDGNLWFIEDGANTVGRITTAGTITEFVVSDHNVHLGDITAGPDGNLWFTVGAPESIASMTTAGFPTNFNVPTSASFPVGIVAGPDGNLWFTESGSNKIGRVTPGVPGGAITEFPLPQGLAPTDIVVGSDGNLWFTEPSSGKVGRITTAGAITEFPLPQGVVPTDIVAGSDGNQWFTESLSNKIGRITTTGTVTEFSVPPETSTPWRLEAGPDGNLWFTEKSGNQIGRITTAGVITEFAVPGQPGGIAQGPDGNLWFTQAAETGRITTSGTFSEFPIPTAGKYSAGIAAGPDGNLWFVESAARKIGRITTAGMTTEFPIGSPVPTSSASPWLNRFNAWRASSNLPLLTENPLWSQGDYNHSLYMIKNQIVTHYEDPSLPYYTVAGDQAARNSNLAAGGGAALMKPSMISDTDAIDVWMEALLHSFGMTDPTLASTGFGSYREVGPVSTSGFAVDVLRGRSGTGGTYPVFFPGPGSTEPLTTGDTETFPCPYNGLVGLPVYVEVGFGVATTVSAHTFTGNGTPVDHCVGDSHDPSGSSWFTAHGAAVLAPKQPLQPGVSYVVSLTVNGAPYTWSFGVSADNSISAPNIGPQDVAAGADGNLWFTEGSANQIGRITPAGAVTTFPLPTANSAPHGITAGPDGNLWFTESLSNKIGRITTAGVISEFPIPTFSSGPHDIAAGPDGNLWFTESSTNKVGRITTAGLVITEFPVPTAGSTPGGIAAGSDGNLWFTESTATGLGAAKIGRITPSGSITEFPTPTPNSAPVDIAAGPDGNIWFTEQSSNQIGRITISTGLSAPGSVRAVAGDGEATLTWTPASDSGPPITGYTVTASPGGATTTVSPLVPAATLTGLTNGTPYTFTVAATNSIGTGPASAAPATVTPTPVVQGTSVVLLPAMSNQAYGGYLTTAYLENLGSSPAHIRVQYFDQSGTGVGSGNSVAGLPPGATWTLRTDNGHSLGSLQAGSAVVYSDQPLATFVNEFAPGNSSDATSYTSINASTGVGSTLYAPAIANNAYGGYTTGIGLINLATTPANITVTYRDSSGGAVKTQNVPGVAAGAYQALYSGDTTLNLPNGFAGTATITSSAGNLAAVVNETGPGKQFSSYDAVPVGSTTLFAPAALRNAYGGYNTGMGIQNTTGTAGTVTITYYDASGSPTTTTHPIAANGYVGVYQGTDIPSAGAYTAKITSTVAIAAIVNEVAPSSNPAVQQSTAYNTLAAGSSSLHLPLVESAGADGWSTGEGIMNTGASPTTVTVTYYDAATGSPIGSAQSQPLQPSAFWGLYQPAGGLPNGIRASAVVTTSAGGQVAVICNESNATTFMSYIGQ